MVVQFGQATMPWWRRAAEALISGTTSGTAGSIRNALDLSTTTAPALTAWGAYSFDCAEPAEKNATSMPLNAPGPTFSTRIVSPLKVTVLPTERSDANARRLLTGNFRSSRILSVVCPTAPVTPTTATFMPAAIVASALSVRSFDFPRDQVTHLLGADGLHALSVDVSRAVPLLQYLQHRRLHARGILPAIERVAQEHAHRQDRRDRIGDPFPGDVGRGAVHGLVQSDPSAEARRREHAHRAREDGRFVGQDVAEGVLRHDRVELRR